MSQEYAKITQNYLDFLSTLPDPPVMGSDSPSLTSVQEYVRTAVDFITRWNTHLHAWESVRPERTLADVHYDLYRLSRFTRHSFVLMVEASAALARLDFAKSDKLYQEAESLGPSVADASKRLRMALAELRRANPSLHALLDLESRLERCSLLSSNADA